MKCSILTTKQKYNRILKKIEIKIFGQFFLYFLKGDCFCHTEDRGHKAAHQREELFSDSLEEGFGERGRKKLKKKRDNDENVYY